MIDKKNRDYSDVTSQEAPRIVSSCQMIHENVLHSQFGVTALCNPISKHQLILSNARGHVWVTQSQTCLSFLRITTLDHKFQFRAMRLLADICIERSNCVSILQILFERIRMIEVFFRLQCVIRVLSNMR